MIDAAMAEGAALMGQALFNLDAVKDTNPLAGRLLDSSAPFYDVYRCRDRRWISWPPWSRPPGSVPARPRRGEHTLSLLEESGIGPGEIEQLVRTGTAWVVGP